jgi:hypothetical protein
MTERIPTTFDHATLTDAQRTGLACVVCDADHTAEPIPSVPVGRVDGCQVFACQTCIPTEQPAPCPEWCDHEHHRSDYQPHQVVVAELDNGQNLRVSVLIAQHEQDGSRHEPTIRLYVDDDSTTVLDLTLNTAATLRRILTALAVPDTERFGFALVTAAGLLLVGDDDTVVI